MSSSRTQLERTNNILFDPPKIRHASTKINTALTAHNLPESRSVSQYLAVGLLFDNYSTETFLVPVICTFQDVCSGVW